MKGERQCREYFDFSQKNCMGSEIFNCENEWSGNPAWLCWRNFWWYWKAVVQSEVLSGWFDYCLVPGLLVASSRTPTCFVTLETCRKNCSESDFLQQATYSQNFLRPGKNYSYCGGVGRSVVTQFSSACSGGEAVHNLLSQGVPCAVLCAFTCSVHRQLLNCKNSFTAVLHLTFF